MKLLIALAWSLMVTSCRTGESLDTPTTGHITIAADASLSEIVNEELMMFHAVYKYANITCHFKPEAEAFADLLADSARLVFATRQLSAPERQALEAEKIYPDQQLVAYDALAVIAHPDLPDSSLTLDELRSLIKGDSGLARWEAAVVVLDHSKSSTARYLRERFDTELSKSCFAAGSDSAVVDYVSTHPNALGIIGVSWISDPQDSIARGFLGSVKVMRISPHMGERGKQPYQAYIADSSYALIRPVYMISREARSGLASGFTAYVASDKGQRIILKSGLVPATMPIRLIEFKEN